MMGCRRRDAGDEDYSLQRRLAAGDDCGALAVRPCLVDICFGPDLPHQRVVGTEIAGMDFRGLQPAAGWFRRVVSDFRHSEILVCKFAIFSFAQITNRDFASGAIIFITRLDMNRDAGIR